MKRKRTVVHVAHARMSTTSGNDVLARFGAMVLIEFNANPGDVDWCTLEQMAISAGAMLTVQVTEPCDEACACSEVGFPTECIRAAAGITAAAAALVKQGSAAPCA